MDAHTLKQVALSQMDILLLTARQTLGTTHSLTETLAEARKVIKNESAGQESLTAHQVAGVRPEHDEEDTDADTVAPVVLPQGFANQEEFDTFIAEQLGEEAESASVRAVVGTRYNEDGTQTDLGNKEETLQSVRDAVDSINEMREQEGEEALESSRSFSVEYVLMDGSELTRDTVNAIIEHPISDGLKSLGNLVILEIEDGDSASVKTVHFAVLEEGDIPLTAFQTQILAYRGVQVIPGIGLVQAVGSVPEE